MTAQEVASRLTPLFGACVSGCGFRYTVDLTMTGQAFEVLRSGAVDLEDLHTYLTQLPDCSANEERLRFAVEVLMRKEGHAQ